MEVEIKIDPLYREVKVILLTDRMTDEVQSIVNRISEQGCGSLTGFRDDTVTLLEREDVYRIYAAGGKVYAVTQTGEYALKARLYEVEDQLKNASFVRISNSEIVNLKKVKNFDLSFVGTIYVKFTDGTSTYVSRRYVSKIKDVLGI